jgi:hypothetical protein
MAGYRGLGLHRKSSETGATRLQALKEISPLKNLWYSDDGI